MINTYKDALRKKYPSMLESEIMERALVGLTESRHNAVAPVVSR
jgi:hypothetical protein